jgi:transposase
VADSIPERLYTALAPMLEQIQSLTGKIREYDKQMEELAMKHYPETGALRQVRGVGALTSVAFVLTIENPDRFQKSRDVAPYLGLVPKQRESGDSSPQLRITKTGDKMLRRLLVSCGHYILGPFGEDCDLRRHGLKIASRGGKNAKKRAVVAKAGSAVAPLVGDGRSVRTVIQQRSRKPNAGNSSKGIGD